jgi:hypothetical protein
MAVDGAASTPLPFAPAAAFLFVVIRVAGRLAPLGSADGLRWPLESYLG